MVLFVETPRKFNKQEIDKIFVYLLICSNKFTWCFHKQNYYMFYPHANLQRTYYNKILDLDKADLDYTTYA
jgi:hypothetical protein